MKVLMIGAGRNVQGGVSTVVNQYYEAHLDEKVDLKYIATMQDGNKLKKAAVAIKALVEFSIRVKTYDVVHVHMSSRASFYRKSYFIKIAKQNSKKIIIHMHGSEFDTFYDDECNEKQKKQIRDIFLLADVVIALSEEWKTYLSKICDSEKIIVLYNAIKMPGFHRSNYSDKNVLFLGRLGERKGVFDLISVIPRIIEKVPQAHFYLGGDGEVEKCKEMCEELSLNDNVTFLGWIKGKDKEEKLQACSTFVLPSYHEGMPMSLLEAMSYGDVVISTFVGGIPKVVHNDVNGYLISAGDKKALENAVITALTTNRREAIGNAAFETVNNEFNIENNVIRLVTIYQSLVK